MINIQDIIPFMEDVSRFEWSVDDIDDVDGISVDEVEEIGEDD